MREVRACKLAQLALIGARAFVENNKGVRRFAPTFMRESDDRYLARRGVAKGRLRLRPRRYFRRRL